MFNSVLLGFRTWNIFDNKLYPLNLRKRTPDRNEGESLERAASRAYLDSGLEWVPGPNESFCVVGETQKPGSPHSGHHCGFNAFFGLKEATRYRRATSKNILGAIASSGKMEIHSTGYRAERAQLIALLVQNETQAKKGYSLAEYYSVPLFYDDEEFVEYASTVAPHISSFQTEKNYDEYLDSWQNIVWPVDSLDDEPSIITKYERFWYKNEVLHRENGPAYISGDFCKKWYKHGKFHRTDGPAYIFESGKTFSYKWYIEDKYHREGGPAWITGKFENGEIDEDSLALRWFNNGQLHNDFGPAVVKPDGTKAWYDMGSVYKCEEPSKDDYIVNRRDSL